MINQTKYLLAAHIGGTKVRVGLVKPRKTTDESPENKPDIIYKNRYSIGEFSDPFPLFDKFIKECEKEPKLHLPIKLEKACIAVAGPVENNICKMSNWNWEIDGNSLAEKLSISPENIQLINDFEAVAYGVKQLKSKDFHILQEGKDQENKPIAVIGAATGMGQSFLIQSSDADEKEICAYATEGGHTNFAPRSHLEFALWQYMLNNIRDEKGNLLKDDSKHISVERVVSGRGIVAIYRFLQDCQNNPDKSHWFQELPENSKNVIQKGRKDAQNQLTATKEKNNQTISEEEDEEIKKIINNWIREDERCRENLDPAAVIASAALKKSDPLCIYTMQIFLQIYGAELGNSALQFLPYGGLYMAGGITPQILPLIEEEKDEILKAFSNKGCLSEELVSKELAKIPLYVLKNLEAGLMGAAYYAEHKINTNIV